MRARRGVRDRRADARSCRLCLRIRSGGCPAISPRSVHARSPVPRVPRFSPRAPRSCPPPLDAARRPVRDEHVTMGETCVCVCMCSCPPISIAEQRWAGAHQPLVLLPRLVIERLQAHLGAHFLAGDLTLAVEAEHTDLLLMLLLLLRQCLPDQLPRRSLIPATAVTSDSEQREVCRALRGSWRARTAHAARPGTRERRACHSPGC